MDATLRNAGRAVLDAAKAAYGVALVALAAGGGVLAAVGSAAMLLMMTPVLLGTAALCVLLGLCDDGAA